MEEKIKRQQRKKCGGQLRVLIPGTCEDGIVPEQRGFVDATKWGSEMGRWSWQMREGPRSSHESLENLGGWGESAAGETMHRERAETRPLRAAEDRGGDASRGNAAPPEAGKGEEQILPWRLREEQSPADTLILAQQDPGWNSDLQDRAIINLSCFKS